MESFQDRVVKVFSKLTRIATKMDSKGYFQEMEAIQELASSLVPDIIEWRGERNSEMTARELIGLVRGGANPSREPAIPKGQKLPVIRVLQDGSLADETSVNSCRLLEELGFPLHSVIPIYIEEEEK